MKLDMPLNQVVLILNVMKEYSEGAGDQLSDTFWEAHHQLTMALTGARDTLVNTRNIMFADVPGSEESIEILDTYIADIDEVLK